VILAPVVSGMSKVTSMAPMITGRSLNPHFLPIAAESQQIRLMGYIISGGTLV